MKKIFIAMGLVGLCAACEPMVEVTQEPLAIALNSSVSRDRLADRTTQMTVRAFLPGEKPNQRGSEVLGATCTLTSDEFRATLTTPRAVILPAYKQRKEFENRGAPGAITVQCRTAEAKGSILVTAQEKELTAVTGAGAAGFIIGLAVSGAIAQSTPWAYPGAVGVILAE